MKVKLKNEPVKISGNDVKDGKFAGINLQTWKSINRGDVIELNKLPEEANDFLMVIGETKKTEKKGNPLKGGK